MCNVVDDRYSSEDLLQVLLQHFQHTLRAVKDVESIREPLDCVRAELLRATATRATLGLVKHLESWAEGLLDHSISACALSEAAEILVADLKAWDSAAALWTRALQRDPTNTNVIARAEEVLGSPQLGVSLERLSESRARALDAQFPESTKLRANAWCHLGRIRAEYLSDLDGALVAYEIAVDLDDAWQTRVELARLHCQRAKTFDYEAAADHYFAVAERGPAEAVRMHVDAALDCDPSHDRALTLLERLEYEKPTASGKQEVRRRYEAFVARAPAGDKRDDIVRVLARRYGIAPPRGLGYTGRFAIEVTDSTAKTIIPGADRGPAYSLADPPGTGRIAAASVASAALCSLLTALVCWASVPGVVGDAPLPGNRPSDRSVLALGRGPLAYVLEEVDRDRGVTAYFRGASESYEVELAVEGLVQYVGHPIVASWSRLGAEFGDFVTGSHAERDTQSTNGAVGCSSGWPAK